MSSRGVCLRAAAIAAACVAVAAHAGGPLLTCNHVPLRYTNPNVVLNPETGPLNATHTNAQANALVSQSVALWNNVTTSNLNITLGISLGVDVTAATVDSYDTLTQAGLSPVIYDPDGTITDHVLGANAHLNVLGFAGSWYFGSPTCAYGEGQAVINGSINVSDTTIITTMAHEIGHLIGLDHTQLDSAQGLATSNYPLMYPIAFRTAAGLHEDDIAAVSALYPDTNFNTVYGQVSGTLLNGVTPVLGGNIWANDVSTGKVYSIVSDYLTQGTGFFKLPLPRGHYQLHVEAIDSSFDGGSSIGPYADTYPTSPSFQPPLYPSAGVPMTPVTLGNGSPIVFSIKPGCAATATFRLDGSGAVAGNCGGFVLTDLGGDGRSDILYRNFSDGRIYRMFMNGFSVTNAALVYTEPNLAWQVVADGDFDGDGVTDLLWRNTSTGQVYMQFYNTNGVPIGGTVFWTEPNMAWRIVATPDFDGDGKSDILWWNSLTGQVYAMRMNGASILNAGNFYTEPNTNWRIVATGDFAGSGKRNQLLWQNLSTGQVFLMTVTLSGGVFSQGGQQIYQEANTAWKIIAAADFNGDGKSDILYRNDTTGQVYAMLMNGPAVTGANFVYNEPNLNWKIVSEGDYDGDGKADILYRNFATGQVYMLRMNGLAVSSQALVYTEPNTTWHVLGPYEYAQ